ncbi:MAG TPA: hypothetical protein PKB13_01115 [Clostridia bacterium]|nr:hypothetical protein [Clostridia bacterium]
MEESVNLAPVETNATESTVAAPVDGEQRTSAAELLGLVPPQETPAETPVEKVEEKPAVDAPKQGDGQDKVGHAFAQERKRIQQQFEQKLANDPLRILGQQIVGDIKRVQPDISEAEALTIATNNLMQAISAREGITPNVARAIYGQAVQNAVQPAEPTETDTNERAAHIAEELTTMQMPDGFDLVKAKDDPAFLQLLWDMPASAAVRVYHAEQSAKTAQTKAAQDVAEKLQARQQLPQPMAKELPVTPNVDYNTMSDDAVLAARRQRQEARLWG